jgi:hypothetical protein
MVPEAGCAGLIQINPAPGLALRITISIQRGVVQ